MKRKKSDTLSLTAINPAALIQPDTSKHFPLELTQSDWLGYSAKLDEAMRYKTNSPQLSAHERERFIMNCELIRRVNMAVEVRNYAMLEIHEAKQWRADYRNVVELARAFDLSKSQYYKAVKSAQINIQMSKAGLYQVRPKGRQMELLSKIEAKYRVDAWQHALRIADEKGASSKVIERALDDYVERLTKKENEAGAADAAPSPASGQILEEADAGSAINGTKVNAQIPWIARLDPAEEQVFGSLMTLGTWYSTTGDPHLSRGRGMACLLVEAALEYLVSNGETEKIRKVIRLAASKDRRIKRAFYNLGLNLIARHVNECYAEAHPM